MATYSQPTEPARTAFARERITVGASAVPLTAATYLDSAAAEKVRSEAKAARIVVIGNPIRFTEEGTAPVATTTGSPGAVGDIIELNTPENIYNFQAIRDTGSDGAIEVVYYR